MAGGGVGEAMLIGAAVGAASGGGMAAVQDKDVLEGALLGGAMGAAGGGIGSALGGAASGAEAAVGSGAADSIGAAGVSAAPGSQAATLTAQNTGMGMIGPEQTANMLGTSNFAPGSQAATLAEQNAGMGLTQAQSNANIMSSVTPGTTTAPTGAAPTGGISDLQQWGQAGKGTGFAPGLTNAQAYGAGTVGGIMGAIGQSQGQQDNFAPEPEPYTGSLSYFKYSPQTFKPSVAPGYADGGITTLGPQAGMFPQSQYDKTQFATPSQMPISREVIGSDYDTLVDPYTGEMPRFAEGGISNLGSYSDGGRLLRGPGDGMSDNIPASIAGKQPARLADGEFVVPADVVSHLGNGSTDAGAKTLYGMMDKVRKARTGSKKQGREINPDKYMPGMASGGIAHFDEGGYTEDQTPTWFSNWLASQQAQPQSGMGSISPTFQPSIQTNVGASPYTMANRPSSTDPQYYQDIYQVGYPDFSAAGYTLGGNLGRWSNVTGEAQRAARMPSLNQTVTQDYLNAMGRAPTTEELNTGLNRATQFNEDVYLQNKLKQLEGTSYKGQFQNSQQLKDYMAQQGMTPQQHYQRWGIGEGVNPYDVKANLAYISQSPESGAVGSQFNQDQYLLNKLAQLEGTSYKGQFQNAQQLQDYMAQKGMTPWQHYQRWGIGEGVSPVAPQQPKAEAPKEEVKAEEKKRCGGIASLV